jgi:hypothetical protein
MPILIPCRLQGIRPISIPAQVWQWRFSPRAGESIHLFGSSKWNQSECERLKSQMALMTIGKPGQPEEPTGQVALPPEPIKLRLKNLPASRLAGFNNLFRLFNPPVCGEVVGKFCADTSSRKTINPPHNI